MSVQPDLTIEVAGARPRPRPSGRSTGSGNGAWPEQLFSPAAAPAEVELETANGEVFRMPCSQWHGRPDRADMTLLARCRGSVLDIGCGPGRHVAALAAWGHDALGIDTSLRAVVTARRRGAAATCTSVFGTVPRHGHWDTALLLDGNIGIGGDVTLLLRRATALVRPGGRLLVETTGPQRESGAGPVRIRHQPGVDGGDWFPWAWITATDLAGQAAALGLTTEDSWEVEGRWFAQLHAPAPQPGRGEAP